MNYKKIWYELKKEIAKEANGENFKVGGAINATKMLILMSEIETDAALDEFDELEEKEGE